MRSFDLLGEAVFARSFRKPVLFRGRHAVWFSGALPPRITRYMWRRLIPLEGFRFADLAVVSHEHVCVQSAVFSSKRFRLVGEGYGVACRSRAIAAAIVL